MKRVIIIGNGASLLSRVKGPEIDSYDVVVRINNFITEGYKHCVGEKTDILFTCRLNEYNSKEKISVFPEVILSLLMNPLDGTHIRKRVLKSKNITEHLGWMNARQVGVKLKLKRPQYPSTGMICIDYMIKRFGSVTIAGFDNFKGGNLHYFFNGKRKHPPFHNGVKEKRYIRKLWRRGKVKFL